MQNPEGECSPQGALPFIYKESAMVIQFTLQPEPVTKPAHDDGRARKRATVSSFVIAKIPYGIVRRSNSGHCSRRSGSPEFRSNPDPWDGGDAA